MSEINELREFLDKSAADAVEYSEVELPGGRKVLAKKLLWSEGDNALQAGSSDSGKVQLARYHATIFAYGAYFQGKNDSVPVRVFNPKVESDLRKIEALPKHIIQPWLEEILRFSKMNEDSEEEAKNASGETEEENSPSLSPSDSAAPLPSLVAA